APQVPLLFGCDVADPVSAIEAMDFVHADTRLSVIGKLIRQLHIDTVVHLAVMVDAAHGERSVHETDVIGTMNVLVGCAAPSSPVRRLVVKSSQAIYGAGPTDPSFFSEEMINWDKAASGLTRDRRRPRRRLQRCGRWRRAAEPGDRHHGRKAGSHPASLRAVVFEAGVEDVRRRRPARTPGRHHRVRFSHGLLTTGGRIRMASGLRLAGDDGRACPRQAGRADRSAITAAGIRVAGVSAAEAAPRAPAEQLIAESTSVERRRNSQKAKVVAPPTGFRLPKPIRRLQRQAPMYALQAVSARSVRLREVTGRDVIDLGRIMEVVQFIYQQRELARRGSNYAVDDFGFDPQWTESFLTVFKALYHDYWRVETTGVQHVPATGRALLVANHAGVLPWDGTMIKTAVFVEHPHPRHVRALVASQFMGM